MGRQVQASSRDQGVGDAGSSSGGHSQNRAAVRVGLIFWAGPFARRESSRRPGTLLIDKRRSILSYRAEGTGEVVGVKDAVGLLVIRAVKIPLQVVIVIRHANHETAIYNFHVAP